MSEALFDARQVRRAFGRAAGGYAQASAVQREIESRLLEGIEYYGMRHDGAQPQTVLDLGCGTATATRFLREQWPKARILAIDAALPMLHAARPNTAGRFLRRSVSHRVCADLRALPLTDACIDLVFCNLALQWVDDLRAAFAGLRRVLKPGGLLLCSTFGPETLHELHQAFTHADTFPHVSPFADIAVLGDALVAAGFDQPVIDRDLLVETKPDFESVMASLRAMGATNALIARRPGLSGRARFRTAEQAYPRDTDGQFPVTWEAIYAQAWAPPHGAPMRMEGGELASMPVSTIPVRRRG